MSCKKMSGLQTMIKYRYKKSKPVYKIQIQEIFFIYGKPNYLDKECYNQNKYLRNENSTTKKKIHHDVIYLANETSNSAFQSFICDI